MAKSILENSLIPKLAKTSKLLSMYLRTSFSDLGVSLTKEQVVLLAHLCDEDGLMQKDLAFITERNKGSLARLISTMEKKHFVTRIPSVEDKRVNRIYITPKGRKIFVKLKPILDRCKTKAQKGLTKKEIEMTVAVLRKIQKNISE